MVKSLQLSLKVGENTSTEILELEFTDEEWKVIESFATYAKELGECSLITERRLNAALNIKFDEDGLRMTPEIPDWHEVIVVLHRARPFLLQSEKTYFTKVTKILGKSTDHDAFRKVLKRLNHVFSGRAAEATYKVTVGGVQLSSEKVLMDYLNSYEYHRDENKRTQLDELFKHFPSEAAKALLLQLLIDKVNAIGALYEQIRVLRGERKAFSVKVRE